MSKETINLKAIVNKPNDVIRKALNIDADMDLTLLDNEQLYDLFKPAIEAGAVIGYISTANTKTESNNGSVNSIRGHVRFPYLSDTPTADGGEMAKYRTLLFTLSSKAKQGNIICINPVAWAASTSSYNFDIKDNDGVVIKSKHTTSTHVVHKTTICDENKQLKQSYDWIKDKDGKTQGMELQNGSISLYHLVTSNDDA